MKTAIGIRFYSSSPEELQRLKKTVGQIVEFAVFVLIAVKDDNRKGVLPEINSWGLEKVVAVSAGNQEKFVPILNFMVKYIYSKHFDNVFFVSAEITLTEKIYQKLLGLIDDRTLVAGAALAGHKFNVGENKGTGETVPWNTLAVWNLKYLAPTGFPLAGEAPYDESFAGLEEIGACAVLQKLYSNLKIKLVDVGSVDWNIGDLDSDRIAAHIRKLESKQQRAQKQMEFLDLPAPSVEHLEV